MKDDLKKKKNKGTRNGEENKREEIAAHLVRDFLASGSRDKTIRIWEAK